LKQRREFGEDEEEEYPIIVAEAAAVASHDDDDDVVVNVVVECSIDVDKDERKQFLVFGVAVIDSEGVLFVENV
jgi:hypothetical protein